MHMRLPVLMLAGVVVVAVVFSFAGPLRIADVILRSPIVLFQQAVARLLAAFADTPTPLPTVGTTTVSNEAPAPRQATHVSTGVIAPVQPVATARVSQRPPALRGMSDRTALGLTVADRLRDGSAGVAPKASQAPAARTTSGFHLAADKAAASPAVPTSADPPVTAQPPVAVQPPVEIQPPSGLVPSGLQTLVDGLVPPGGLPSPGQLVGGILPAGTVIGPDGVAQLPSGVQVPVGIQLSGTGQTQIGPAQIGPVQIGPVQTGPIQIGPGSPGSGSGPVSGGPVSGGPIQIGPVQITLP